MKAQKPAEGILKTSDFGSYKSYYVSCDCGSSGCSHDIYVEADDMQVSVIVSLTATSKWYEIKRWKQIWTILTKGYVDVRTEIFMNEQTTLNYAETLKTAMKDVKVLKNVRFEKTDT